MILRFEREYLHHRTLQAREEERKQVARELHDQIIQALVGLNYQLSDMRAPVRRDIDDQITGLQTSIRQTIDALRCICADLRPPALDILGLAVAVRSHVRMLERRVPFQIALRVDGDAEQQLPEEIALCVFRVLQEALINVRKHAAARQVQVHLVLRQESVCLTVQDDGKGFQVPERLSRLLHDQHFGLVGLHERLDLVDGILEVESVPDNGTSIRAWVPLPLQDASLRGNSEVAHDQPSNIF
jgi:two-component system, NarL family, sensor histidine kinase DegS